MERPERDEERQVLEAVYANDVFSAEEDEEHGLRYHFRVVVGNGHAVLVDFLLPAAYPNESPPVYELRESFGSPIWIEAPFRQQLHEELLQVYRDYAMEGRGQPIVYQWIEHLQERLQEAFQELHHHHPQDDSQDDALVINQESHDITDETDIAPSPIIAKIEQKPTVPLPTLYSSEESIVDRKSIFIAHLAPITSLEEIQAVVEHLKSIPRISKATHPTILAYRFFGQPHGNSIDSI
jgi:hypothetical protein